MFLFKNYFQEDQMNSDLRSFISLLKKEKELTVIDAPVDPYLEIAEIHRRVTGEGGNALLFTNVKGKDFPVVTNLIGSRHRVELAAGSGPEIFIKNAVKAMNSLMPPTPSRLWQHRSMLGSMLSKAKNIGLKEVSASKAPVLECRQKAVDLTKLPAIKSWPEDGGSFVTLPLVYTEDPETGISNLGMYRIQIKSENKTGIHWQIQKGGGFHFSKAENMKQPLPVSLFVGGPLALTIAAITALPESVPELLYASFLMNQKLRQVHVPGHPHPLIADAEFAVCGIVPPGIREPEGPFGDHYGYYSLAHDFPVFQVQNVWHRKDAIWPATVVGRPKQEDYWIGEWMQDLLSPLYPVVMPGVTSMWNYAETGYHSLTVAKVRESYSREAVAHGFRILGEGQLSLTKILMLTDADTDLRDFKLTLMTVLERFRPEQDLFIINDTSIDTLDYTGRKFNEGSKAMFIGTGEKLRQLPEVFAGRKPAGVKEISVFCPGCLTVSGPSFKASPAFGEKLAAGLKGKAAEWPLVVIVDNIKDAASTEDFLWTVFTRFSPACDIYGKSVIKNNKIEYSGPVIIDARMKPWYPGELIPDPEVSAMVDRRWKEYGL